MTHLQKNYPYDKENEESYKLAFDGYLKRYHQKEVVDMLLVRDKDKHYSIEVAHIDLLEDIPDVAFIVFAYPINMLPLFDAAVVTYQKELLDSHDERSAMEVKHNCHVRIHGFNFQNSAGIARYNLPRSEDVGILLEVKGTVIRTAMAKTLEYQRIYRCTKCKHTLTVNVELEQMYQFPKPPMCTNVKDGELKQCGCRSFKQEEGPTLCKDYQEIKIQEHVHKLGMGSIPRSMLLILQDDLVDKCQAGDDITVSGIVVRRWRPVREEERCDMEVVVVVNHVRVNNEQRFGVSMTDELKDEFEQFWKKYEHEPLKGRNTILANICPGVHGMFIVKLGVALAIVGGVARIDPQHGTRIRGESHMLMVGEPGTGKSQFLKYASKLGSRCVLTTGVGTTSAGLTVSAVKDQGGEWVLEAGALVLADGGVCCIDEFSSIRERDRATIHEAMEQQTLSVAKAGLVCKLHTRTTVLAATNAKGKYDPEKSISVNTTLASPLLSRFDIVLVLLDEDNQDWDKSVSDFILKGHQGGGHEAAWPMDKMQAYFAYIKSTFQPVLQPEAKIILGQYYRQQRRSDSKNAARTTIRLLESLIRIAQAHARFMFRHTVETQDAVVAVVLMEASITTSPLFQFNNPLHSTFPENPDEEYTAIERNVLRLLELEEEFISDSQLSAHARADRDERKFGLHHPDDESWMRVRPGNGRNAQAPSDEDENEFANPSQEIDDEDLSQIYPPPDDEDEHDKPHVSPHQHSSQQSSQRNTDAKAPYIKVSSSQSTTDTDTQSRQSPPLQPKPHHQPPQQQPQPQPQSKPQQPAPKPSPSQSSQSSQSFHPSQPSMPPPGPPQPTNQPSKSSYAPPVIPDDDDDDNFADLFVPDSQASKPSTPSTPLPPKTTPAAAPKPSTNQTKKAKQFVYNEDDECVDSLQVDDEEYSTLTNQKSIPSSDTTPSSLPTKPPPKSEDDFSFLNDPPNPVPPPVQIKPSPSQPKPTPPPSQTKPVPPPSQNNKRKEADEEDWDNFDFNDDDIPPVPAVKAKTNQPVEDEDLPLHTLKKKKFVE